MLLPSLAVDYSSRAYNFYIQTVAKIQLELDHYEYNGSKEYLSVGFISFSNFVPRVKIERHLVA